MAISAAERAFRQAQSNISKPNAPVAVARYVPSYASPAAQKRQTVQNLQAPGVPAATPRLPSPSSGDGGGKGESQNIQAPAPSQASQARGPLNWRDAAYNAQIASIQRALADFETGATTRGERYGQDFTTGLNRLGYRPAKGFQAMPNVLEQLDQPQPMARALSAEGGEAAGVAVPPVSGGFDIEGEFDPYSAAARGTRSTRDEFAGRGTLRSSDFAKTFGEFQNRLNQQLGAMETSRTRFGQDLATEVAQQRTQSQERQQAAQRDAMLRAAMAAAGGAGF
jgi:hypothetical protein